MAIGKSIRVYVLAREVKQDAERVMEDVRREGGDVSVASNSVSFEIAEKVRSKYFPKNEIAPKRAIKVIKTARRRPQDIVASALVGNDLHPNYRHLDLSNHGLLPEQLEELIPHIIQIENLIKLDLEHNNLDSIHPDLFKLPDLLVLNLSKNSLTSLPSGIDNLQELEVLNLSNNKFERLPDFLSLSSLRELNVDNNQISELSEAICGGRTLRLLKLNGNYIRELPNDIGHLFDLERLELNRNQLTGLPSTLSQLGKLRILYLGNNRISGLPVEIGRLFNLTHLYLEDNQLHDIGQLTPLIDLVCLKLTDNPLEIPAEILADFTNPRQILKYYLESLKGTTPFNEGKIVLIGQGRVGKSSLREALISDQHKANQNQKKTEGLEVVEWNFPVEGKGDIRLNLWDFGGQEVYHATHQFFFKSGLYILVVDLDERVEWRTNRLDYWLKKIQSLTDRVGHTDGAKQPVIIIGNKSDANTRKSELFDIKMLQAKFVKLEIATFIPVACHTGMNIQQVIREIHGHLEKIGVFEEFPATYLEIKRLIQDMDRNFLSRAEFIELAKEDVEQKLYVLEKIGAITTFAHSQKQELKDLIVVKPKWITNGIYKILSANYLLDEKKGEVEVEEVKAILDDSEYPQKEAIIEMMKEYDICFSQTKYRKEFLMFPSYFSVIRPALPELGADAISFRYTFKILLDNIFPQFVVNLDKAIFKNILFWRTGLRILKNSKQAVVEVDLEENTILITVEGETVLERKRFLDDLRAKFEEIISNQEAVVEISVPGNPNAFVDYRNLVSLQLQGEFDFPVENLGRFSIDYLLYESVTNACVLDSQLIVEESGETDEERIVKLGFEIIKTEALVEKYDEEARRLARFHSLWFLIPLGIITSVWIGIIFYVGWNDMEIWTYVLAALISFAIYAIAAWKLEEINPFNPKKTLEKEKSRLYDKFNIDLPDLEFKKTRLLSLKND